jgi:hypothetical protein
MASSKPLKIQKIDHLGGKISNRSMRSIFHPGPLNARALLTLRLIFARPAYYRNRIPGKRFIIGSSSPSIRH